METLTFSGPRECLLEVGEEVGGRGKVVRAFLSVPRVCMYKLRLCLFYVMIQFA